MVFVSVLVSLIEHCQSILTQFSMYNKIQLSMPVTMCVYAYPHPKHILWQSADFLETCPVSHIFLHFKCLHLKVPTWRPRRIHHHHHISVMELGHLLTRSGLMCPEVSSKVCHNSFCHLGNSVSLPWVIYYGAFYLHVVSSFSSIPVIFLKLVLFLTKNF